MSLLWISIGHWFIESFSINQCPVEITEEHRLFEKALYSLPLPYYDDSCNSQWRWGGQCEFTIPSLMDHLW